MRSLTYAIFVSGQALIYAFCRSYCCGLQKNYFSVFPKTKLVSFTCDPRWFPGQSLRENSFLTRNAVDRSYRHCHLSVCLFCLVLFFLAGKISPCFLKRKPRTLFSQRARQAYIWLKIVLCKASVILSTFKSYL